MQKHLNQTKKILKKLISFDTTSCYSNLKMLDYIKEYCKPYDVRVHTDYNKEKTKANLIVSLGPNKPDGIVLSGHSDVVPVAKTEWSSDPFNMTEKNGKLYGRGTSDMKGFLACIIAMLPVMQKAKKTFHLVFSYDEEVGCQGIGSMVKYIEKKIPKPKYAIIGEPTSMQVIKAHKSIAAFKTTIIGHKAHSSLSHKGVNAIVIAQKIIGFIDEYMQNLQKQTNKDFIPPYTTYNIGTIKGGLAINIIPGFCEFEWEIRGIDQNDSKKVQTAVNKFCNTLEKKMQKTAKTTKITTECICGAPALQDNKNQEVKQQTTSLLKTKKTACVSFATEAGIFQQAKIPAVVCGPGSIEQAHKTDEYIEISQLEECLDFLERLIKAV